MIKKGEKPLFRLGSVPSAGTKEASGVNRLDLACTGVDPSCYLLAQPLTNSRWRSPGLKRVGPHGEAEPLLQAVCISLLSVTVIKH